MKNLKNVHGLRHYPSTYIQSSGRKPTENGPSGRHKHKVAFHTVDTAVLWEDFLSLDLNFCFSFCAKFTSDECYFANNLRILKKCMSDLTFFQLEEFSLGNVF
jgi:hypothetical protein